MLPGKPHTTTHSILVFHVLRNLEKLLKVCGLSCPSPRAPLGRKAPAHRKGLGGGLVLRVTYLPGWGWLPGPVAQSMNAGHWLWLGTAGWAWWSLSSLPQTHHCKDSTRGISQSKHKVFRTSQLYCKPITGFLSGEVWTENLSLRAEFPPHLPLSPLWFQTVYVVLVIGVFVFGSC